MSSLSKWSKSSQIFVFCFIPWIIWTFQFIADNHFSSSSLSFALYYWSFLFFQRLNYTSYSHFISLVFHIERYLEVLAPLLNIWPKLIFGLHLIPLGAWIGVFCVMNVAEISSLIMSGITGTCIIPELHTISFKL